MGKKKIRAIVRIQIEAGKASPAPPVGQVLGPHGINIMEFCRTYNERTASSSGAVIPAEITIFEDRSFTFVTKTPPAASLILKAAGVDKGSARPHRDKVGRISRSDLESIAVRKLPDLNTTEISQAVKMLEGTARSLGVEVGS